MATPDLVALASQMGETLLEIQQTLASFSALTHNQMLDRIELQRDDAISALRTAYEKQTDALATDRKAAWAARLNARRREDEERECRRQREDYEAKIERARQDDIRALEFVDATHRIEESAEAEIRKVELQAQQAMDGARHRLEELEGRRQDLNAKLTSQIRRSVPAMPQSRVKSVNPISEQDFAALMLETDELEILMAQNTPEFRVPFSAVSAIPDMFDWLVEKRHRGEEKVEAAVGPDADETGGEDEAEGVTERELDEAKDNSEEESDDEDDEDGKETATPQDFLNFCPILPTSASTTPFKPKLALSIPQRPPYASRKGPMTTITEVPSAVDFPAFVQGHEHVDEAFQATTPIFIPPSAIYMPSVTEMVIGALGIISPCSPSQDKRSTIVSLSSEVESVASTVLSVDGDQDTAPSTPGTVVGVQVLPLVIKRKPVPANSTLRSPLPLPQVVIAVTEPTPVDQQKPFFMPTPTEKRAVPISENEEGGEDGEEKEDQKEAEKEEDATEELLLSDTTKHDYPVVKDEQASDPPAMENDTPIITLPAATTKDIPAPISPYDLRSTTPPPDHINEPLFNAPPSPTIDRPPTPVMTPDGSPFGGVFNANAENTPAALPSAKHAAIERATHEACDTQSVTPDAGPTSPAPTVTVPSATTARPATQRPSPIHRISFTSLVAASSEPLPILSPRPRLSLVTSVETPERTVSPPARAQTDPSSLSQPRAVPDVAVNVNGVSSLFQRMRSIFESAPPNETPLAMTAAEISLVSPVVGRGREGRVPSGMFYPVVMRKVHMQTSQNDSDVTPMETQS